MGLRIEIECNKCGEDEGLGSGLSFAEARAYAREHGWVIKRGNVTYCYECVYNMQNPDEQDDD